MRGALWIGLALWIVLAGPAWGWQEVGDLSIEDHGSPRDLLLALDRQARCLERMRPGRVLRVGAARTSREELLRGVRLLSKIVRESHGQQDFGSRVLAAFRVYRTSSPAKPGRAHFTGYYDPILEASKLRTEEFSYPIYGRPNDLVERGSRAYRIENGRQIPYYTRAQIEGGALEGRGLEVAWVKDYVELHYTHIQGSALLHYPDGRLVTLHFAGANGYNFKSAVRMLMKAGLSSGGYAESKRYLREHPDQARTFLLKNPRYIFFRTGKNPPSGAGGVALTAGRSIATDKTHYSLGGIAYIRYSAPVVDASGRMVKSAPTSRLVVDNDTGNAIRGPGRADLYIGVGPRAEALAGATNTYGELFYLLPR